jgi:hypothetical protein
VTVRRDVTIPSKHGTRRRCFDKYVMLTLRDAGSGTLLPLRPLSVLAPESSSTGVTHILRIIRMRLLSAGQLKGKIS